MPNRYKTPHLMYVVPCQHFLVDARDQSITLSRLLEEITFFAPPPDIDRSKALVAFSWSIVTQWFHEESDIGKEFEQKIELIASGGTVAVTGMNKYEVTSRSHRLIANLDGMPIASSGYLWLNVLIKNVKSNRWHPSGRYPLNIKFESTDEKTASTEELKS